MFNDSFGLTQAALDGRKTQTRRIITPFHTFSNEPTVATCVDPGKDFGKVRIFDGITKVAQSRYRIGEVVAVVQSYRDTFSKLDWVNVLAYKGTAGWKNKMFVAPDLMKHRIKIKDIRVEKQQDISFDDCLAEGILEWKVKDFRPVSYAYDAELDPKKKKKWFQSPIEAYLQLCRKIYAGPMWAIYNPLVFVYEFELIK